MKKNILMISFLGLFFFYSNNCYSLDSSGSCGTGCTYTYDEASSTLVVTASGNNARITEGKFSGSNVDNIIIDGNFSSIGTHAFLCDKNYGGGTIGATISGKNGKLVLPANGWNSFGNGGKNTLTGEIELSPDVDKINQGGFYDVKIDGTLIISDNIKSIDAMAFYGLRLAEGAKIYCAIDNCAEKILDSCKQTTANPNLSINGCRQNLESILSNPAKFEQAPEGCSYWSANGCKKCSNASFKMEDNYCYRRRYTPTEAAQVVGEENTIFLYYK